MSAARPLDRAALRRAIGKACQTIRQPTVYIYGAGAILATWDADELPGGATHTAEVDLAPVSDIGSTLVNKLFMEAGDGSEWALESGFPLDPDDASTPALPSRWRDRAIHVEGDPEGTGICPEAHDLCASKIAAFRPKDQYFVRALIVARMVRPRLLRNRFDEIPRDRFTPAERRVRSQWIIALEGTNS